MPSRTLAPAKRVGDGTGWGTLAALLLCGLLVTAGQAQEAARELNWSAVRKTTFASIDRTTAARWVKAEMDNLLALQDAKAVQDTGGEAVQQNDGALPGPGRQPAVSGGSG